MLRRRAGLWLTTFMATIAGLTAAAVLALPAGAAPRATRAALATCTDSWKTAANGDWTLAGNWTSGVPVAGDDVCIKASGTYTVTMEGAVTVKSLVVNAGSGRATLQVGSTCSVNTTLTTTNGLTVGSRGIVTLTNSDGCGNNAAVTGPIGNSGTIETDIANGGARSLQGSLTNNGTLTINQTTSFNNGGSTLTNQGAIAIGSGASLNITTGASFTNGAGGSIAATGSGMLFELGGTFTQGAGTTTGTPVVVDNGNVAYAGAGASAIALHGSGNLSGAVAAGQTLSIESTCSEHANATAAAGFTNAGTIVLTNGDGCGNNAALVGGLASSGTIRTELAFGGARHLDGNLTNTGTVTINQTTHYTGGTFENEGAVSIADGVTLNADTGASVTNDIGGSITATGSGQLIEFGGTFSQGSGTTSGSKPVVIDDGNLVYAGAGASTIAARGNVGITGDISTGQTLTIESTCAENATATAAGSFTNAGAVTLTNGDGCGNNAVLTLTAGTLANSGTLEADVASGGARAFNGGLTNTGTVTIDQTTSLKGGTLVNHGAIAVADGVSLNLSTGASFTNGTGGSIAATGSGTVFEQGGTFTENAGTTSGSKPVVVDDATLAYTGTGASTIAFRGFANLSGTIGALQTLSIESTCSEHATANASVGFTNNGTIVLTNGDLCGNNAALSLGTKTLLNKGTVHAVFANGGQRIVQGKLSNAKSVIVDAGSLLSVSGAYTQASGGTFQPEIATASTYGRLTAGGAATLAGTIKLVAPFAASAGQTFNVLSAASRTGTFTKTSGLVIDPLSGLYYLPTYSGTGASLVVMQPTMSLSAPSGAAGSVVTVSGTGYAPGDKVTISFVNVKNKKTNYAIVTAAGDGSFTADETVPATAPAGAGHFSAKSGLIGFTLNQPFTVS